MECLICNSNNQKNIFSQCTDLEYAKGGKYNFYKCGNCGLIYINPVPSINELLSFYPSDYHGYTESRSALTKFLINLNTKSRARLYKKLIGGKGNILDVGSADGNHFSLLNKYGKWNFWGIEFNEEIAKKGRNNGFKIITDTLENHNFNGLKFDLIIMNNLIEHVTNPVETLNKAKEILNLGGIIIGETPNVNSLDFHLFGKYWGGLHVPRHTFIFDKNNLRVLGEKVGLSSNFKQKIDTNHWAGSLQNFLQSKNLFKVKLKNGRAWYYSFLLLFFVPLNFFQKLFGYSGVIMFEMKNNDYSRSFSGGFENWNEKMAQKYNPENYFKNSNFIVKFIENSRRKNIIKLLNPQNEDRIIELGCGAGNLMEKIKSAKELTGVDISDFLIDLAKRKKYQVKTKFVKANIEKLPQEITETKFDKIYCSEVLEHVESPENVLREVKKIISKNGTLVVSIPNENLINKLKNILIKFKIFSFIFPKISKKMDEEWHLHFFNINKIKKLTEKDYYIKKIKRIPFGFLPIRYVIKLSPKND